MRVLYDTNLLVKAFSRRGEILIFKELLSKNQIAHITSDFILGEVETVLVVRRGFTKQKAKIAVRLIARLSKVVKPSKIERLCRDPDDDNILAAAIKGSVDYLVTADNDLLVIGKHRGVKIISSVEFGKVTSL